MDTASSPFEYPVRIQPHHTDYAGIVWHGTYIAWMEEARIECLRSRDINFADWVNSGADLPVVDLSLRYRQSLTLGMDAVVRVWLEPRRGIRLVWQYDIQNQATGETCVLATVTLVPVDHTTRKVLRRLPALVKTGLDRLYE
ncbi:MAG: acyl-CoA thioesterase [Leptolyngbya sp. SIO1E4]|nr:acyl-CoA thioesterase [Leptolyngbya sp. SIO1E4]